MTEVIKEKEKTGLFAKKSMVYECEVCGHSWRMYKTGDNPTPLTIDCKCGSTAISTNWNKPDVHEPPVEVTEDMNRFEDVPESDESVAVLKWELPENEKRATIIPVEMSHWIPCSEMLPRHFKAVLITEKRESGPSENLVGYSVCQGMYLGKGVWRGLHKSEKVKSSAVAWMNIPEPFIESED